MSNKELATKIVKQKGLLTKEPIKKGVDTEGNKVPASTLYILSLASLGYTQPFLGNDESLLIKESVKYITAELDSGNLALSDTWAEDNLE